MLVVTFAPTPARAQANEPLKPYVVMVLDTSGSMVTGTGNPTGSGPPSCGGADNKLNHAKCAIYNIASSFGDMVFALGRFRMSMAGTTTAATFPTGCTSDQTACTATDDRFELLTPLVDGNTSLAASWVNSTGNTCTATGTDPEIWRASGATPLEGSLRGTQRYWQGLQATDATTIWPSTSAGFDPIRTDPTNLAFLPNPLSGASTCNANRTTCNTAANCTGTNCCCFEQCRPYIVILLTDGDETCMGTPANAAASLLVNDLTTGMGANAANRRYRVETKPIGFGKPPGDPEIEAIAHAGGAPDVAGLNEGYYASDEAGLQLAISNILADAIRTEICNGRDDDCDLINDEGFTTGMSCNNGRLGQCRVVGSTECRADGAGTQCSAGREPECVGASDGTPCNVVNSTNTPASPGVAGTCISSVCQPTAVGTPGDASNEIPLGCNNLDDDCDGLIDENVTGCVCIPSTEICDGDDDDCDGNVDENTSVPCANGTCTGVRPCNGAMGLGTCTAAQPGPAELCNGIDDTCDGIVDGFQESCSNMYCPGGTCTGGTAPERTCVGGARAGLRCDTFPALDPRNNPGGNPASACEMLGVACVCNPGNRTCPGNPPGVYTSCVQEVQPSVEICNLLDDDCDGRIDETPAVTCSTDTDCAGTPMTPACDMGMCRPADCSINSCGGELICTNGVQACTAVSGIDTTCNGVDEDCDMKVDEGWVCTDPDGADNIAGNADDCPCTQGGLCNAHESCENGGVVCTGDAVGQESCNCLDDNCNGQVDEGALCGTGAICTACQCALQCVPGEFACPMGKSCVATGGGMYCLADPCFNVTCPTVPGNAQICRPKASNPSDKECVSACDVDNCATPNICYLPTGECKPDTCETFPERCAANENCINGACVGNPCDGVTCATGEYCVAGQCYSSCADVDCPVGQRCRLGTCEADPCDPPCPGGQFCQQDASGCIANPCEFVVCPGGQYCNPYNGGQCEDDPCQVFDVTCAEGEKCFGGTCFDAADFLPDAGIETHVTTGGGGGCSTNGTSSSSVVLGLGLILLLRRRRGGGAA